MNKFFEVPILGIKFLISAVLLWFAFAFNNAPDYLTRIFGFFLYLFIALCTIFIFFFRKKFLAKFPKFLILWRIIFLIYIIAVLALAASAVLGFYRMDEKNKTQAAIDFINSKKISLDDVMGKNLPPKPDQDLNNSTIAGIDANNNFIRDDVELYIFAKYPNSAKIRAAELQYAQALQLELTQVFNSETLVKILQKRGYGQSCIDETDEDFFITNNRVKEIEKFVINTNIRQEKQSKVFDKYMTTYSVPAGKNCEINFSLLPN